MHTIAGDPSLPPVSHSERMVQEEKKIVESNTPRLHPEIQKGQVMSDSQSLWYSNLKIMAVVVVIKSRMDMLMLE